MNAWQIVEKSAADSASPREKAIAICLLELRTAIGDASMLAELTATVERIKARLEALPDNLAAMVPTGERTQFKRRIKTLTSKTVQSIDKGFENLKASASRAGRRSRKRR